MPDTFTPYRILIRELPSRPPVTDAPVGGPCAAPSDGALCGCGDGDDDGPVNCTLGRCSC